MLNDINDKVIQFSQLLKELKLEHPDNDRLQMLIDPFTPKTEFEELRDAWKKDRYNKDLQHKLLAEIAKLLPLAKSSHPELDYAMLYNLRNLIYKYP